MKFISGTILFLALINYTVLAQNNCKITGVIKDSEKYTPIAADARLFTGDTVFVKGTKCDSAGYFVFDGLGYGTYRIEITLMEYSTLIVDNIKLDALNPAKTFDTLKLKKQNVTTDEIVVEEQKGLINFSGDKKVFNVDQSTLTKGGNALDVLKKVPMVDVDINDNVTLRGSQNVKILIDDKPPKFVSLKQIPADAVERVEIITNPSAKYESEGVTGIINLVMKKDTRLGFQGMANLSAGSKDRYWGGINLSMKKNKFSVFGSSYLGVFNYSFDYTGKIDYYSPVSYYRNEGLGTGRSKYFFLQGGAEYEFSKKHTLGFEANYNRGNWNNVNNSSNIYLDSVNNPTSSYSRDNGMDGIWQGTTYSLYYNGKLSEQGREVSGDLTFTQNKNDYDNSLIRTDYDGNGVPVTINPYKQVDSTAYHTYNLNAQMDYVHPLGKTTKFEAGYKGTFRQNDNDFTSDSLNYSINSYTRNFSTSNHFKLTENINAVYGVFSSSIADFTYKLGLRFEHTNTIGELLTGFDNFRKNYLDVFPTVSISRSIGQEHQIQLAYSRRVTRPNIWRMNPFVNKNDPKIWYVGNPNLNPEYTDSYELSYMFFNKLISVTPMAFFRQSHDVISSYSVLNDSNVLITSYLNTTGTKSYGLDLVLSSKAFDWLNLNGTLSLYDTKFDKDPLTEFAEEEGFSWKANVRASLNFGALFNIELYYNYVGKKINAQGKNVPTQNLDIGVSRDFFHDMVTLSLRASDIFKTMQWGQDVSSAEYFGKYRNNYDSQSLFLTLSVNFGNTSDYIQKKKKTKQNQNEQNDQGQDQNNGNMGR